MSIKTKSRLKSTRNSNVANLLLFYAAGRKLRNFVTMRFPIFAEVDGPLMKSVLSLIVLFANASVLAADPVKVYLAESSTSIYPVASCSLGDMKASEKIAIDLEIVSNLKSRVEFNNVKRACSCTKIAPESGAIEPGGSLRLRIEFSAIDLPVATAGGVRIDFAMNEVPEFGLRLQYNVKGYFAFTDSVVTANADKDGRFLFETRYLKSDDIQLDRIRFKLGDGAKNPGFRLNADTQILNVSFDCDTKAWNTVSLTAEIDGAQVASNVAVLIQEYSDFRVFPSVVRFSPSKEGSKEGWSAVLFVKRQSPASLAKEENERFYVTAELNNNVVDTKVAYLNDMLARVTISTPFIPSSEASTAPSRSANTGTPATSESKTLTVLVTSEQDTRTFARPAFFFGATK